MAFAASAQTTAEWWIEALNRSLGDRYGMNISVAMAESESLNGYFMVDGDSYYITLGVMEVYSDGKLRHEINNERKEVTIDNVDLSSVDLLTNPTHAFDFVGEEFAISVVESSAEGCVLSLVPRDDAMGVTEIRLALRRDVSRVKGADRIALISDSLSLAGTDIKSGRMQSTDFIIEDGVCKLLDRSAFAGSIATADRLVRVLTQDVGIPMCESVRMMSEIPAKIMRLDSKGTLTDGKDADITVFDENIDVCAVFVGGNLSYQA